MPQIHTNKANTPLAPPDDDPGAHPQPPRAGPHLPGWTARPRAFVRETIGTFAPASMPLMARRSYAIEIATTFFFAVTLAVVEGGVISVYTKQTYAGIVPEGRLNFVVAVIGAAPELANLVSFLWAAWSVGRPKVPFINALQAAVVVLVALIAAVPGTPAGLWVLLALVIAARVSWSGIITLRPTLWRNNYPPRTRARIVGKFSTVQQLTVAVMGIGIGAALDRFRGGSSAIFTISAALGLIAVWTTSRQRARRGKAALREETSSAGILKPWQGPAIVWRVLRQDLRYAQFMLAMFVLGFGNLMVTPLLVIVLKEQFGQGYLGSILVTAGIPYLIMPFAIPLWARFLDRAHVVKFRSIHGWVFAVATLLFALGCWTHQIGLLYAGAVVMGIGYGGGTLAWNLGHVDFAPPTQLSQYMATHVSLNGLRGLAAPLLAVGAYEWLGRHGLAHDLAATTVLAASVVLCVLGCAGFVWLRLVMGPAGERRPR